MYYEIWQQFDPEGTQYLPYNEVSDFLDVLEPPLQIHKPNKYKVISMDIPICTGDLCFCVDVLDALTKDFFARKGMEFIFISDFLIKHFWCEISIYVNGKFFKFLNSKSACIVPYVLVPGLCDKAKVNCF